MALSKTKLQSKLMSKKDSNDSLLSPWVKANSDDEAACKWCPASKLNIAYRGISVLATHSKTKKYRKKALQGTSVSLTTHLNLSKLINIFTAKAVSEAAKNELEGIRTPRSSSKERNTGQYAIVYRCEGNKLRRLSCVEHWKMPPADTALLPVSSFMLEISSKTCFQVHSLLAWGTQRCHIWYHTTCVHFSKSI